MQIMQRWNLTGDGKEKCQSSVIFCVLQSSLQYV